MSIPPLRLTILKVGVRFIAKKDRELSRPSSVYECARWYQLKNKQKRGKQSTKVQRSPASQLLLCRSLM